MKGEFKELENSTLKPDPAIFVSNSCKNTIFGISEAAMIQNWFISLGFLGIAILI